MKINKDKPLPDHTKLDYDECCAKLILEELFPDRYHDLLIADKPDLQGNDVGIEVTIANDRKMQEALSNWIKAYNSPDEKIKGRYIDRMAQLGVKYTGGVQVWPGFSPTFDLTRNAIEAKISKLKKGNYKSFPRYELFVFTDTWHHEAIVEDAKRYIFRNEVSECYETIYVLSEGADLHVFETGIGVYQNIKIDSAEQSDRNIRARQMVENAEEDC